MSYKCLFEGCTLDKWHSSFALSWYNFTYMGFTKDNILDTLNKNCQRLAWTEM